MLFYRVGFGLVVEVEGAGLGGGRKEKREVEGSWYGTLKRACEGIAMV